MSTLPVPVPVTLSKVKLTFRTQEPEPAEHTFKFTLGTSDNKNDAERLSADFLAYLKGFGSTNVVTYQLATDDGTLRYLSVNFDEIRSLEKNETLTTQTEFVTPDPSKVTIVKATIHWRTGPSREYKFDTVTAQQLHGNFLGFVAKKSTDTGANYTTTDDVQHAISYVDIMYIH